MIVRRERESSHRPPISFTSQLDLTICVIHCNCQLNETIPDSMHRLKLSGAGSAHNRTTCLTFFWCCICRWQVVVWQGFTIPGRYGQGGTWILFSTLRILNFVNMYNCHYDNQISLVELTIIILLSRTFLRWGLSSCVIENYLWEKIRVPIIGPKVLKKTKFLEHRRVWEIHCQNILKYAKSYPF